MITLVTAEDSKVQVDDAVAFQLHSLTRQIQTNQVVHLPHTSHNIMNLVIEYCQSVLSPSKSSVGFIKLLDDVTLFNLIQAAHHLKVKSLMDQTCQILVDRVRGNSSLAIVLPSSLAIMQKFDMDQFVQAPKRPKRNRDTDRLRSHRREEFIDISNGLYLHDICFDLAKEMKTEFSKTKDPELDNYVAEFLKFSNFLVEEDYSKRIKKLCSSLKPTLRSFVHLCKDIDPRLTTAIENLQTAVENLHNVTEGRGLADLLSSEVASRLVMILNQIDLFDIKCMAAEILSRLSFDKCGEDIKEAIPVLLKSICNEIEQVAVPAASTLARLAYESSKAIEVSHFPAVKHALIKHRNRGAAIHLSMFMVFFCRGKVHSLSDEEEKEVLHILEYMIANIPMVSVRACYALSYLTFARNVAVKRTTCKRLMDLTSDTSSRIVGSALGVVGNIVRWGSPRRIKWLVKDFKLIQCLEQKVLCSPFKKFQMEGCRIISNIAAQNQIYIKDTNEAGLTHLLCSLLKADEFDVKMEAAWAVFNMNYNVKYNQEYIDNYEKVEQERSG